MRAGRAAISYLRAIDLRFRMLAGNPDPRTAAGEDVALLAIIVSLQTRSPTPYLLFFTAAAMIAG